MAKMILKLRNAFIVRSIIFVYGIYDIVYFSYIYHIKYNDYNYGGIGLGVIIMVQSASYFKRKWNRYLVLKRHLIIHQFLHT